MNNEILLSEVESTDEDMLAFVTTYVRLRDKGLNCFDANGYFWFGRERRMRGDILIRTCMHYFIQCERYEFCAVLLGFQKKYFSAFPKNNCK